MVDIPGTEAIVFNVFFCVCVCCLWRCMCVLACRNQRSILAVEARDQSWLLLRNHLPHLFFFQIRFCAGIWGLPLRLGWLAMSPPETLLSLGYKVYATTLLFYMASRDWTLVFMFTRQVITPNWAISSAFFYVFSKTQPSEQKTKTIFEVLGTSLMTAEQRIGVSVLWDKIIYLHFVSLVPSLFFRFETISPFFP